jgi:hypothetical protein
MSCNASLLEYMIFFFFCSVQGCSGLFFLFLGGRFSNFGFQCLVGACLILSGMKAEKAATKHVNSILSVSKGKSECDMAMGKLSM